MLDHEFRCPDWRRGGWPAGARRPRPCYLASPLAVLGEREPPCAASSTAELALDTRFGALMSGKSPTNTIPSAAELIYALQQTLLGPIKKPPIQLWRGTNWLGLERRRWDVTVCGRNDIKPCQCAFIKSVTHN